MKLSDLIRSNTWLSVEFTFSEIYPDQNKNLDVYGDIFEKLKWMEMEESDFTIELKQCYDDETMEEDFVEVYGLKQNPSEDEKCGYALEYSPWNEWLGMTVSNKALTEFTEFEIIAHCLYEMTFMGFDEETIREEMDELNRRIEEIENMTEEEKKANLKSSEDFLKELRVGLED